MFKKLLVAVLALAFIVGMFSSVLAIKNPNDVHKAIPPQAQVNPQRINSVLESITPTYTMPTTGLPTKGNMPVGASYSRGSGPGTNLYYDVNLKYFWNVNNADMRFSTHGDKHTLNTLQFMFNSATSSPAAGITAYVWYDNGFGFPGSVIYSVNVPHASVQFYPNPTTINVAAANIVIDNVDYHVGFIANNASDNYRIGSDDGSGAVDRSRVQLQGNWFNFRNTQTPNIDVNFSMTVNATVAAANIICADQVWNGAVALVTSDKLEKAVRFTANALCTLKTVKFYIASNGRTGSGGVDINVYGDVAGLPGPLIQSVHVINASIISNTLSTVNMLPYNLVFGLADYHVSVKITNPANQYELAFDNGATNTGRSSVFSGGLWVNSIAYGTPVNFVIQSTLCCSGLNTPCYTEFYYGSLAYFWRLPDIYGDYGNAMRFSNATACTLKTLEVAFYAAATVGAPGATFHTWSDAGGLPGAVTNSFPVNPVTAFYPTLQVVNVAPFNIVITGDYHMGVEVIQNTPTDVIATLSDNGAIGTNRSSENFGAWGSMLVDWGLDVNFLMQVGKCCVAGPACFIACNPLDQWPTFAHDYNRSSQSGLQLGDVCGIREKWAYDGTVQSANNITLIGPVIANDKVYQAYNNRLVCLNLLTGAVLWDTRLGLLTSQYALLINNNLQTPVTVEGNAIYFGTGALKGFVKANATTGDTIWTRSASTFPLTGVPGTTRVTPSIIVGNEIYFGDDNGQIYALDKTTGADLYFAQLLNANSAKASVNSSPSTDGTKLFFGLSTGTGTTGAAGGVRAVTPGGAFTANWFYVSPFQATLNEGYIASPSYRCNNLFIQSSFTYGNALPLNPAAYHQGIRENLDPLTGAEKWVNHNFMGRAGYAPPATTNNLVYFSNEMGVGGGDATTNPRSARGVRAVNFSNTTVWLNAALSDNSENNVWNSAALTCDPWTIYGTASLVANDGHLIFANGNTGAIAIDYALDGRVMGPALAKGSDGKAYVVAVTRWHGAATGTAGRVLAFCDQGARPRLVVPSTLVAFAPTSTVEVGPVQRTHTAAIKNTGCATLTYSASLVAGAPPVAGRPRVTPVDPQLEAKAAVLSAQLTDYSVENMNMPKQASASISKFYKNAYSYDDQTGITTSLLPAIKPAKANSSQLAPPSWVSWIAPSIAPVTVSSSVAAAGSANWTFQFNRALMQFLGDNYYYVDISTNDPDYIAYASPQPAVQAEIEYHIQYVYCTRDTGRMDFGNTGSEWWTNDGEFGDGLVNFEFTLDGTDSHDYESSIYFMTSMNTAAWNPYGSTVPTDFGFLFPYYISGNTCGSCTYNTTLPVEYTTNSGASYANTVGDLCSFAVIDSGQDFGSWPNQAGPSMGILVKYREVGTYGADFGAFKLVVMDIINRNASPISGLYYGMIADWDVSAGGASDNGDGDVSKSVVLIRDDATGNANGIIGLPLAGSYFADGSKTQAMYNARINDNTTEVYPPANYQLDSLYDWANNTPQGTLRYAVAAVGPNGPQNDYSYEANLGKTNLAGNATHSFGFAQFGLSGSAGPVTDAIALGTFVNKYAGFARGDVNNDGQIDLRDVVYLSRYVAALGNGPYPFKHLGDVNNDGAVDGADCTYLANYFFTGTNPPKSAFKF